MITGCFIHGIMSKVRTINLNKIRDKCLIGRCNMVQYCQLKLLFKKKKIVVI